MIAMDSNAQNMSNKTPHVSRPKNMRDVDSDTIDLGLVLSQNIEPLRDDNWIAWKLRITRILRLFGVIKYVTGTEVKPASDEKSDEYNEWKNHDLIARMVILNNISHEQMDHVASDMQTASGIWDRLKEVHQECSYQEAAIRTLQYILRTRAQEDDVLRHVAVMNIKHRTLANFRRNV
ncbi:hypothetical protein M378DRAFT_160765 [Amanita muscaria Koide BX008]|uniref:Uncharacterized protein n=1 Tax=Amanita muscaria (strain Koide BX008) TaxID=946122 RepID=A0A0C2XBW6_AMAMK|nr:hypothetical protein M378DRAFT_160765 [Amanita muscaria Koide BX008]